MKISNDAQKLEFLNKIDGEKSLKYVVEELFTTLGLTKSKTSQDLGLSEAEYMLFETIFNYSKSLEALNIKQLQSLFKMEMSETS